MGSSRLRDVGDAKTRIQSAGGKSWSAQRLTDSVGTVKGSVHEILSELKNSTTRPSPNRIPQTRVSGSWPPTNFWLKTTIKTIARPSVEYQATWTRRSPHLFVSKTFSSFLAKIGVKRKRPWEGGKKKNLRLRSMLFQEKGKTYLPLPRLVSWSLDGVKSPVARRIIIPRKEIIFKQSRKKEAL